MRPFGATNKPGTCKWCGRKLGFIMNTEYEQTSKRPTRCSSPIYLGTYDKKSCGETKFEWTTSTNAWRCKNGHHHAGREKIKSRTPRYPKPGFWGNGYFCTQGCAVSFGLAAARSGTCFKPKKNS